MEEYRVSLFWILQKNYIHVVYLKIYDKGKMKI